MILPGERHYNPYRKLAATADADALWAVISDPTNIHYMIGAIRVGRPAIDAIAEDLCTNRRTAHLFKGDRRTVDQWKQFSGKLVAIALKPEGFHAVDEGPTFNNAVIKNGAHYVFGVMGTGWSGSDIAGRNERDGEQR